MRLPERLESCNGAKESAGARVASKESETESEARTNVCEYTEIGEIIAEKIRNNLIAKLFAILFISIMFGGYHTTFGSLVTVVRNLCGTATACVTSNMRPPLSLLLSRHRLWLGQLPRTNGAEPCW